MDKGTAAPEAPQGNTEATAPIVFKGRTIQTYLPNEAQIAVIARLSFWDRNIGQDVERIRGGINRVGALLAGLMVDRADWEWIEDGMASREIQWEEVLDIFDLLADAHGLTNREDRRRRARATGSKARRG